MCHSHIFALGSGERYNFLSLGGPGNSTTVDEEGVAQNGTSILGHAAIHVSVALEGLPGLSVQQPELACARQVVIDTFDSLPVCRPGICGESSHSCNGEHNVGMGGK